MVIGIYMAGIYVKKMGPLKALPPPSPNLGLSRHRLSSTPASLHHTAPIPASLSHVAAASASLCQEGLQQCTSWRSLATLLLQPHLDESRIRPQQLCSYVQRLGEVGPRIYGTSDLWRAMTERLLHLLRAHATAITESCPTTQLQGLVQTLARFGLDCPPLAHALLATQDLAGCSNQELGGLVSGLAQARHVVRRRWLRRYGEELVLRLPSMEAGPLVDALWGLGSYGHLPTHAGFGDLVLRHLQPVVAAGQLDPGQIRRLLCALAGLSVRPDDEWMACCLAGVLGQLSGMRPRQLADVLSGLDSLAYSPCDPWWQAIVQRLDQLLPKLMPDVVAELVVGMSHLHVHPSPPWCGRLLSRFVYGAPAKKTSIVGMLVALPRLLASGTMTDGDGERQRAASLEPSADADAGSAGEGHRSGLPNGGEGDASVGVKGYRGGWARAHSGSLERLVLMLEPVLGRCDCAELAAVAGSLARLGFFPGDPFLRRHDSAMRRLRTTWSHGQLLQVCVWGGAAVEV